jgi:peptide/nickel transport system substrate-binding protein
MAGTSADNHLPPRYANALGYPVLTPWVLVDEPTPGEVIYERNPYYYKVDPNGKQLPYIDRLHKVIVSNIEVYTAKILAGETDIQFQYTRLADYPIFKENEDKGDYNAILLPAWQEQQLVYCILLDPIDPVYAEIVQDKRFRQAVSMAVDREEVKNTVFLGFGRPAQVAPPKGQAIWEQRMEDAYAQHDVDAANALLDEMGL